MAAAASRVALAALAALAAGALWCPRASAEPALDAREVLGSTDDLRITSAAVRLTAYEQRGRGFQSRAGGPGAPGSERVTVFEPQLEVIAAHGKRLTHRLWIPVDIVTAASPNAIDRGADVVSQASRQNEAATLDWSTRFRWSPDVALSFRGGLHVEEIWRSWHAGLGVEHAFAEKNTVVSASVLSVFDWFDGYLPTGRKDGLRRRGSNTASIAVTQVLSRTTLAEVSYGLTLQNGVLGNDWNVVPLARGGLLEEAVPTRRLRHATVGRLVQALPWQGAIKGYYRLYTDDWSVASHTWEAQLHQHLVSGFDVAVGARLHTQSSVAFFTTQAGGGEVLRTADSDLQALSSRSWFARASLAVPASASGRIDLSLSFERYLRTNELEANVVTWLTGFSY